MKREPKYSNEEYAKLGNKIYQEKVQPLVKEKDRGKIVVIDIESGEFEVGESGETTLEVSDRLFVRFPDAQACFVRIGHQGVHRIGTRETSYTFEEICVQKGRELPKEYAR